MSDDVLYCIASYIAPNPFTYLRLSTVNKSWHHVFTSDKLWRHLNPQGYENKIAYHFIEILSNNDLLDTFMYWNMKSLAYLPPKSDDPYSWLGLIANFTPEQEYSIQDPPFFTTSKHLLLCAINLNPYGLYCASEILRDNKECVEAAVSKAGCCLQWASPRLKNDPAIVLAALKAGCRYSCPVHGGTIMPLAYGSQELRKSLEFALKAVVLDGLSLRCFSKMLRDNRELVLLAIQNNPMAIKYTSLRHEKSIALAAVDLDGLVISHLTTFADDPEVITRALLSSGSLIQYASPRLRDDYALAELAIGRCPFAICYLSPRLSRCVELAKLAVSKDGLILREIPHWANDREVVFCAVAQNIEALLYASPRLQASPQFIMRVVSRNGMALKHVRYDLRNKPDVALAAATQNGESVVKYLDDSWRACRHLLLVAIKTYPQALHWASKELQSDPKFLARLKGEASS